MKVFQQREGGAKNERSLKETSILSIATSVENDEMDMITIDLSWANA